MISVLQSIASGTQIERPDGPERFVVWDTDWETYDLLRNRFTDRPIRLTFDGKNLEIMSPSLWHEVVSSMLGRFVERLAEELGCPIVNGGTMTFRRRDLQRGLEPDKCFWISHEPLVRGRRLLDLNTAPPPDLVIEVDVTRSSLDRIDIYSRLGVPEIWRCDGHRLEVLLRQESSGYLSTGCSAVFPFLPAAQLVKFLPVDETQTDLECLRKFLNWVRPLIPAK